MSDLSKPEDSNDEEFESLLESFGSTGAEPSMKLEAQGEPKQKAIFRRRDKASQPSVPEETQEAATPLFDPDTLKTPLDLDATRQALLAPEPEEIFAPTSAQAADGGKPHPARKPKRRAQSPKVKPAQLLVLGVLLVLVLAVYGALGLIIARTRPQESATPIPLLEMHPAAAEGNSSAPTAEPAATTNPPTLTSTPEPIVSTQFDLQLLQDPDNVGLRINRGYKYLELQAYDLAMTDFEHALSLEQQNPIIHIGLGQTHFYARRWEKAETALSAAVTLEENNEEAHFWLGTVLYAAGRYADAAAEFDWAAELNPENPRNESWLALAAALDGQLPEAEAAAERAIALNGKFAPAYLGRAQVRVARDELEAAQGDLLYARNLAPYNFDTLHALGRFYADHVPERIVEAERLVLQAQNWATWDFQQAQALHTLGRIYLRQGRSEEAQQVLTRAENLAWVDGRVALMGFLEDLDRAMEP